MWEQLAGLQAHEAKPPPPSNCGGRKQSLEEFGILSLNCHPEPQTRGISPCPTATPQKRHEIGSL